jgi:hypothetical protein
MSVVPVVGEPSRFAVEYDLNASHGDEWMFGRFCYWCGGRRVGDYELGTSLRDVLFQLEHLARDRSLWASRRFNYMSAIDVFRLLNAALFGAAELNNASVAEEEQWYRHNVFPPVDVFDCWKGFLLEDQQTARLIFARKPYLNVIELSLRAGEVDAVLDVARKALGDIYEHELSERTVENDGDNP